MTTPGVGQRYENNGEATEDEIDEAESAPVGVGSGSHLSTTSESHASPADDQVQVGGFEESNDTDGDSANTNPPSPQANLSRPSATQRRWSSTYLGFAYLSLISTVPLVFLVAVILLFRRSTNYQYIYFSDDTNHFSAWQEFTFKYLPIFISIIYVTLWSFVDHDAKRLEPYFQLSKPDGATLKNSFSLTYLYDFGLTVPIYALKRRHWFLGCVSSITVLLAFVMTPLAGALFAIEELELSRPAEFTVQSAFRSPLDQLENFTTEFLYDAYGTAWLGAKPPAFSTPRYGVAPISLRHHSGIRNGRVLPSRWRVRSVIYTTNVNCVAAAAGGEAEGVPIWIHPNRRYCGVGQEEMLSFSYVRCPSCLPSTVFAGMWHGSVPQEQPGGVATQTIFASNATLSDIVFCDISYHRGMGEVVYSVAEARVVDVVGDVDMEPFPDDDSMLNTTLYGEFIGGARWDRTNPGTKLSGFPITWPPPSENRLREFGLTYGVIPPLNQGIGLRRINVINMTRDEFVRTVREGHRSIFAHAIPYLLANRTTLKGNSNPNLEDPTGSEEIMHGIVQYFGPGVVVVPVIAYLLMSTLSLILVLIGLLLYLRKSQVVNLASDPASIAATAAMLHSSESTLRCFKGLQSATSKEIEATLRPIRGRRLHLTNGSQDAEEAAGDGVGARPAYQIEFLDLGNSAGALYGPRKKPKESLPFFFSWKIACVLVIALLLLLSATVVGFMFSQSKGIPWGSDSLLVRRILFSIIPIGMTQGIEPIWVVILRKLAALRPFVLMKRGLLPAIPTVLSDYTSSPSSLLFIRSFGRKGIMLNIISFMPLLSNVLTLATGAVFTPGLRNNTVEISCVQVYISLLEPKYGGPGSFEASPGSGEATSSDHFIQQRYIQQGMDGILNHFPLRSLETYAISESDHFTSLKTSIRTGAYPSWTTKDHFFLPVVIEPQVSQAYSSDWSASLETVGFAASLSCQPISVDGLSPYSRLEPNVTLLYTHNHRPREDFIFPGEDQWDVNITMVMDVDSQKIPVGLGRLFPDPTYVQNLPGQNDYDYVISSTFDNTSVTRLSWFITPFLAARVPHPNESHYFTREDTGPTVPRGSNFTYLQRAAQSLLVAGSFRFYPHGGDSKGGLPRYTSNYTIIACEQRLRAALFKLNVDNSSRVMEHRRLTPYQDCYRNGTPFFTNESEVARFKSATTSLLIQDISKGVASDGEPDSWLTYTIAQVERNKRLLDPEQDVPTPEELAGIYSRTYTRLFPHMLGQNLDRVFRLRDNVTAGPVFSLQRSEKCTISTPMRRQLMLPTMTLLISVMLLVNILAVLLLYFNSIRHAGTGLPRVPSSLQDLIPYFANSRGFLDDVRGTENMSTTERREHLISRGGKYSCGFDDGLHDRTWTIRRQDEPLLED